MKKQKEFDVVDVVTSAIKNSGYRMDEIASSPGKLAVLQCHYIDRELGITDKDIQNVILAEAELRKQADISDFLTRRASSPGPWVQMLMAGTAEELAVAQAVMDSWIWQIKRKMSSSDPLQWNITAPIMPVFVGENGQGDGKSYLVEKHIKPQFSSWMYSSNTKMDTLNSYREQATIADYYIVSFDEMAGARKTEKEALKSFITEFSIGGRGMYQSTATKKTVLSSCIATSNISIRDLIPDNSGMRRFFEIPVDAATARANREARDAYPWGDWIASIDVSGPDPKAKYERQISGHQKNLTHDTVRMWTEDSAIDNEPSAVLYENYTKYCRTAGLLNPVRQKRFKSELKERGWTEIRTNNARLMQRPVAEIGDSVFAANMTNTNIGDTSDAPEELFADPSSLFNFVVQSSA